MTKTNAPTMKDVAREAGVSLGTVSKVINRTSCRDYSQHAKSFFCSPYRLY